MTSFSTRSARSTCRAGRPAESRWSATPLTPSFLSGQGSSLALVGAYVLAGELAVHSDPADAFASYERITRPFMEANQALAKKGGSLLMPRTQEELDARNATLAAMQTSGKAASYSDHSRQVHNSLRLPDYTRWLHEERRK